MPRRRSRRARAPSTDAEESVVGSAAPPLETVGEEEQKDTPPPAQKRATARVKASSTTSPGSRSEDAKAADLLACVLAGLPAGAADARAAAAELAARAGRLSDLSEFSAPAQSLFLERPPPPEPSDETPAPDFHVNEFNCLDVTLGADVEQTRTALALSDVSICDPDGVGGLPRNLKLRCNLCSAWCPAEPWPIYTRQCNDGRWEVRGVHCSPGCAMRRLINCRMVGKTPVWKANTALVIRRRMHIPIRRAVPVAPPLELRVDHGGYMSVEEWCRQAAVGAKLPEFDIHSELAPGGLDYGRWVGTTTTLRGASSVEDTAHQWKYITQARVTARPRTDYARTVAQRSTRQVPAGMRSCVMYHAPDHARDSASSAGTSARVGVAAGAGVGAGAAAGASVVAPPVPAREPEVFSQLNLPPTQNLLSVVRAQRAANEEANPPSLTTNPHPMTDMRAYFDLNA